MLYPYRETLLSKLYPGSTHSSHTLERALDTFGHRLALSEPKRHKITWRLDGGFGGDKRVEQVLKRGYEILVKEASNRRAGKLATEVKRWRQTRWDQWIGPVETPESFSRPLRTFVVKTKGKKRMRLAYLYTTLPGSGVQIAKLYDQRGGAETEFRADKSGGCFLHKRRKHKRDAQEAWIYLTDMAHNYLSWFREHDSPFADYGPLRICRDLMHVPGVVEMDGERLLSVKLLRSWPKSEELLDCLARFWD